MKTITTILIALSLIACEPPCDVSSGPDAGPPAEHCVLHDYSRQVFSETGESMWYGPATIYGSETLAVDYGLGVRNGALDPGEEMTILFAPEAATFVTLDWEPAELIAVSIPGEPDRAHYPPLTLENVLTVRLRAHEEKSVSIQSFEFCAPW